MRMILLVDFSVWRRVNFSGWTVSSVILFREDTITCLLIGLYGFYYYMEAFIIGLYGFYYYMEDAASMRSRLCTDHACVFRSRLQIAHGAI